MDFFYDIKNLENVLNPIYTKLWERVSASSLADPHYSGKVDVTEILKPFAHITLDGNYKLIAYSSYETHGTFGKVVAIENDKKIPDVYLEYKFCLFQKIIPDNCYPVNEVIFCDGTPEGFFEAIILENVLFQLFSGYKKVYLQRYYFSLNDVNQKLLFEPSDYTPKFYENDAGESKLLILEQDVFDNTIELCEYSFSNKYPKIWQKDEQYSHIEFKTGHFTKNRSCCYFSSKRICVSQVKEVIL